MHVGEAGETPAGVESNRELVSFQLTSRQAKSILAAIVSELDDSEHYLEVLTASPEMENDYVSEGPELVRHIEALRSAREIIQRSF